MVKHKNPVKQYSDKEMLSEAFRIFYSLISKIPFIKFKYVTCRVKGKTRPGKSIIKIFIKGKPIKFILEAKAQGEPRLVRMAINQLKDNLKNTKDTYGILAAPYLSDASRQICKEAGVGCIDLAGNALISVGNIYIDIGGVPNPYPSSRIPRSVFSPKSSRVLRVLLSNPAKRWYVEDLSREAGISIGLTSRVKQSLLAMEWIREENKSFYSVKPEEVLNQWTANYSYKKNPAFSYYSMLSEEELEAAIKRECEKRKYRYGLALFSGARKVAPFVRFMKFFSYIDGNIEDIAAALELKKVESGANVTLLQPYDDGVFYGLQNVGGANVVSDIQLYLDLKEYKGRGEEAAQAIFEKRIKPKW
jgi:hypothetical protein